MQLSSLDLSKLEVIHYRSKQVERIVSEGKPRPRTIYKCSRYCYKVWSKEYRDHRTVYWRGKRRLVRNEDEAGNEVLLGFLYGLYDDVVCSAFVEHIYDGSSLVGYVTLVGQEVKRLSMDTPEHSAFVRHLRKLSLRSGFIHRDLKPRNVITLGDGRLSLIDLECPLTMLSSIGVDKEVHDGSLAGHTFSGYQKFVREYLNPETTNASIRRAQERFAAGPPDRFLLSVDDGQR